MEDIRKNEVIEIELCDLDLSLAHTRIRKDRDISRLQASIGRFGQITPVSVIQDAQSRWLLVDGYRRIMALKGLGLMQAMAEIWLCDEKSALVRVMTSSQSRQWEPIEQAVMIRELCQAHHLSQNEVSCLLGCSQSWISRRMALIEILPSEILHDVLKGRISS